MYESSPMSPRTPQNQQNRASHLDSERSMRLSFESSIHSSPDRQRPSPTKGGHLFNSPQQDTSADGFNHHIHDGRFVEDEKNAADSCCDDG